MTFTLTRAIRLIMNISLDVHKKAIVNNIIALIDVLAGHLVIDRFNYDDIVKMINKLSIA